MTFDEGPWSALVVGSPMPGRTPEMTTNHRPKAFAIALRRTIARVREPSPKVFVNFGRTVKSYDRARRS